jgi:hypothetical protein
MQEETLKNRMESFSTRKSLCTSQVYSEFVEINLRRYTSTRIPVDLNKSSKMNTKYHLNNFVGTNSES